ncbi:DUF444 family protein [Rugamonas apoptosis]|uniref:DUF444 family protein n=1 Tax=Rugamonas apoptosis TaxID=2758570 RepID=A0A7W2IKC3_9BURK|nr:DUF444 family protein [Rugamonas apoptosis]MBA5687257.1 DUF444 family protein [Rugamonas apoptosis]
MAQADAPRWYQLFSRGARDWLRHNDKLREALQGQLPAMISAGDAITSGQRRTIHVPLPLLTHARLRLADGHSQLGVGQGGGQPGELLRPAGTKDTPAGQGGGRDGTMRVELAFSMDDIIDWLWEEFKLPDLQPRRLALLTQPELLREGWDKRGARSRLDRRRTVKEALKRRAVQPAGAPFTNEDLRFRQLVKRPRPACAAAVFFVLDVSASMTEVQRSLAKTFFFYATQGLRRHYQRVDIRFIAHTAHAWEFAERDFLQASGDGGTLASSAFQLALTLMDQHYGPDSHNCYLFYASDGENFTEDRNHAGALLTALCGRLNYLGYVETLPGMPRGDASEMTRLCAEQARQGRPIGYGRLARGDDVWHALRTFFAGQAVNGASS